MSKYDFIPTNAKSARKPWVDCSTPKCGGVAAVRAMSLYVLSLAGNN
jgi:hypothetical protein